MKVKWASPEEFLDGKILPRRTGPKPGNSRRNVLTDHDRALVFALRSEGMTLQYIADTVGVSEAMVSYLLSGKRSASLTQDV